ncbi:ATP-binding domain-containing protein [Streptacidiphilus jiangxiensis]|uniref:Helix-hairpin-helix containing domain-containing protein n=1 Tax=Streptacidiphilus jiangxiensis TaxID=235985 RepID=A0A1H7U7Y3_STRJI|nr:ATP-binding domain-containing protein [Streptacidiphilus jiangxiensis]SEL92856.1 Helix-hairpin-helix containing domain-containing protein [Streptacidiphilus jiangxiensis]
MTDSATTDSSAVVTEQLAEAIRAADGRAQDVDAQARDALADTAAVLGAGGAPAQLAGPAVAALGERAAEVLREDPWAVLSVPGVLPANADAFARGVLGADAAPGDARRANALVQWLLERAALHGHTAVELPDIRAGLAREGVPDPDGALLAVVTEGRVMTFQEEGDDEDESEDGAVGRALLALDRFALAEESLADGLVRLVSTFPGRDAAPGGPEWVAADEDAFGAEEFAEEFGGGGFGADAFDGGNGNPAAGESEGDSEAAGAETGGTPADEAAASAPRADQAGQGAAGAETGGLPEPGAADVDDASTGAGSTEAAGLGDAEPGGGTDAEGVARPGWDEVAAAAPNSSAAALIRAVAEASLVLHTGGETARNEPVALLHAARRLGLRAALAAAHADSARRLDGGEGGQGGEGSQGSQDAPVALPLAQVLATTPHDADGSLALDLLIVCDAPALDVELAATLVESLPDGARLVLSGDPGELWSPGPGRVFADLLAAKPGPVVASRQPDFGPIGELVSGIGIGEFEPVASPDKEVVVVEARDAAEAVHRAVQLVVDSIPRALGIPVEQVRVLTPVHSGPTGTRALNAALKARLNPGPGQFGGFDAGDAVVHAPTPSALREGVVRRAVPEGLEIAFGDETAVVARERIGELRHGWALTAHQAVGRRWPGVVVVATSDAGPELTRQWLYTACGRAERHLSLVSALGPGLPQAVATQVARPRTTRLRVILAGE